MTLFSSMNQPITKQMIDQAAEGLRDVVQKTPLQFSKRLSEKYKANIYIKREDLQEVRSFKIRGAYNKIASLSSKEKKQGVVCASAGNHAQGVAYSCATLKINGVIFMPVVTPNQKIEKVRQFGGKYIEIKLVGETFDDANIAAIKYCQEKGYIYIAPFNDVLTIAGQGTIGKEIYEELPEVDVIVASIGGGGLISGIATYAKSQNTQIQVFGAEPAGATSMLEARIAGHVVSLPSIDTFVDGAAVRTVGDITFAITEKYVSDLLPIPEGQICTTMIELYQSEGIIAEPAGALSIAALDSIAKKIKGKIVVCVLSGGNNDLLRYPEILERSLVYQGRKHYFIIEFAQKPGQLKAFVNQALGPTDDIVRFEYIKKTNKEKGPALVGIELQDKKDLEPFLSRMNEIGINYRIVTADDLLYNYLI